MDYALNTLRGTPIPAQGDGLTLPLGWLLPQLLLAIIVASYPTFGFGGYATHALLRVGSRAGWWFAKWCWLVVSVLGFYVTGALIWSIYGVVAHGFRISPDTQVEAILNGFDVSHLTTSQVYGALAVPLVASLALSTVQMVLAFAVRPMLALVLVVGYLAMSALTGSSWLIGDYAMVARNRAFDPRGQSSAFMCLVCAAVTLVAVGLGIWSFSRRDVLHS
ncbi:hypothetical protein SAMN05443377_1504 [Propionibacterium cyclohexanicum]|uniref:Uncharacterized protein n=1 Tax=Propionibacterium cyclohexanicum TaxID=64702 RepID=A0A1H9U9P4_9ACTN|nr:hypothetical protein SAMN05443377_1504 [Propionibacterium cyclohexanicum]